MLESLYFVYNGVNSQDLGITQVQVSQSGLYKEQLFGDISIIETQIRHKKTPYYQGLQRTPLEFSLTFAFDQNAYPGVVRQIANLFWTETYLPFYTSDNPNRIWMCMPANKSAINHNGMSQGYIELDMRCDSPYMYAPTVTTEVYTIGTGSAIDNSDLTTGTLTNLQITN